MKEYESLKTMYPEHISLDHFRFICHIAKRSALYLIQHEIVPAINTGKQTWRYKIALDDVIVYLRQREQRGSMIPSGAVSSRSVHNKKHCVVTYSEIINPGEEDVLRQYFTCLLLKNLLRMTGCAITWAKNICIIDSGKVASTR